MITRVREQLYDFDRCDYEKLYFEVARRNTNETEVSELGDLEKTRAMRKTVLLKFGWFSLRSYFFQFDPPLEELEFQLKLMMQESLEKLSSIRQLNCLNQFLIDKGEIKGQFEEFLDVFNFFQRNMFYGPYAFIYLLYRFEFYFSYAKDYERFLQHEIREDVDLDQKKN